MLAYTKMENDLQYMDFSPSTLARRAFAQSAEQRFLTLQSVCNELPGGALVEDVDLTAMLPHGDVYQFGVARGRSLSHLIKIFDLPSEGEPTAQVWGFDTFTGMPEEAPGESTIAIWSKGHFNPGGTAANASVARAVGGRVGWVIGDYDKTLVPGLREERGMKPARYVDIDCDLYRSSARALHWMFESGLVGVGTVIGYDDFWDLSCSKQGANNASERHPFQSGEGKAHFEVTKRFGVYFRCICGPCQQMSPEALVLQASWRTYFVVEDIRPVYGHNHGFAMPNWQHAQFLQQNARCKRTFRNWQTYKAKG